MDYKKTDANYGGVESIVLSHSNGHDGFIDSDPTIMYLFRARDAAQAEKIVDVFLRFHGRGSLRHIHRRGNVLYLTPDGLSKLEMYANRVGIPINPKYAKIDRK